MVTVLPATTGERYLSVDGLLGRVEPWSVTVYIPTPFRRATNNRDASPSSAPDVGALLDELETRFGGLKGLVRDDAGEVHHHVNIYVNSEAIESLQGLDTASRTATRSRSSRPCAGGGPALEARSTAAAGRRGG